LGLQGNLVFYNHVFVIQQYFEVTDAEIFGNLMMFASAEASFPSSDKESSTFGLHLKTQE
jgi:hypothetical protein